MTASYVNIVEAAYNLDDSTRTWLAGIARAARPILDRGEGILACIVETRSLRPLEVVTDGATDAVAEVLRAVGRQEPAASTESYRMAPTQVATLAERFFGDDVLLAHWQNAQRNLGLVDGVGIYGHSCKERSVHLQAMSKRREQLGRHERRAWLRVAVHLAAGYRVRTLLGESPVGERFDALLDPKGRLHEARRGAEAPTARRALRDAVQAMERARGRLRHTDGERALELWRGLVAGRWSLVDRWDADGKRFIAAIENRPSNLDPRALRAREGAAARLAADGAGPKDIAYALGISPSNARAVLASALGKLGLSSRAEFYRWSPERAHVQTIATEPRLEALVLTERSPHEFHPAAAKLTEAELVVARLAADGATNAQIARTRGTSVRTIANQMARILRKLGITSRAEILR